MSKVVDDLPLGPVAKKLYKFLADTPGRIVPASEIVVALYGDKVEDFLSALASVRVTIFKTKARFEQFGLSVVVKMGRGGGYSLCWADDKLPA